MVKKRSANCGEERSERSTRSIKESKTSDDFALAGRGRGGRQKKERLPDGPTVNVSGLSYEVRRFVWEVVSVTYDSWLMSRHTKEVAIEAKFTLSQLVVLQGG